MKRQKELGVRGAVIFTVVFAIMAILTYSTDSNGNPLIWIPVIGVVVGIALVIFEVKKSSERSAREEQQENFGSRVTYDSTFGDSDLKMYFDSSNKKVTVCATTINATNQEVIEDFVKSEVVKTDSFIVTLDSSALKVLRAKNINGSLSVAECCIKKELEPLGIVINSSTPVLKAYNDYAFVTDDINEFVVIVTSTEIHVLRYSDIVSVSYEENGNDVYNKSLGGAVVGGLLFGGVGAIVGGNTAKTTQNKEVKEMSIKILLKSTSKSTIILKIYEVEKDTPILETKNDEDRKLYEDLMNEVAGIKDIFSVVIDIVDKSAAQKKAAVVQHSDSSSVADELTKLAKLKEQGLLSDEEFEAQKKKILNL